MKFLKIRSDVWETVFGVVYMIAMTNLLMTVSAFPLVVVLAATDPVVTWPLIAVTAVLAAPAVPAAFAVFAGFADARAWEVVRTFWAAWRRHLRRSLALGAMTAGLVVVISVDAVVVFGSAVGAVVIPILVVLLALVLSTATVGMTATVERPDARLRDVLKASLYLSLRRWYLTAVSLLVLGLFGSLFVERPAIALGLAMAPLLYVVWGNSRYTLAPVLLPPRDEAATSAEPARRPVLVQAG